MTYKQFNEKLEKYYQKIGVKEVNCTPVIHNGFPGNFNLSVTEYEFLNQNSNFLDLKKDMVYAKTQSCIRFNDFNHIVIENKDSYRYLARFTIATPGGIFWQKDRSLREARHREAIQNNINFLVEECGLDIKKIHVQYLKSGKISEITNGKYLLDKIIPTDPYLDFYRELGVLESNFIPVQNRDGLLSLNVYGRTTPWGYRNEIYYEYKGKLLDIGTVENLMFEPIYDTDDYDGEGELIDLIDYKHTLTLGGIGVERVLMIINGFDHVNELDIVAEPAKILAPYLEPLSARQLVQTLRAISLIVADGGEYENLDKRRKEKMRVFWQHAHKIIHSKQVPLDVIKKVLGTICETEPMYAQMKPAINTIIREYKLFCLREKYGKRWHEHSQEIDED